jgi:hypothetical protein
MAYASCFVTLQIQEKANLLRPIIVGLSQNGKEINSNTKKIFLFRIFELRCLSFQKLQSLFLKGKRSRLVDRENARVMEVAVGLLNQIL